MFSIMLRLGKSFPFVRASLIFENEFRQSIFARMHNTLCKQVIETKD